MNDKIKIGSEVDFTPSESTRTEKFKKKKPKKCYKAKVTDLNEASVDLTVFDNGQMVFVKNIKHSSVAEEGESKWDLESAE